MGEVYRAADSRLERKVALKVLRKGAEDDGETWGRAVARMLREARAVAALSHPSIVAIYDVGEHDGTPFIAMELIEGAPMRAMIGAGKPLNARLHALLDVARALAAAHQAGLIHRDIKPENVIVRPDGAVKVLDFGIARRTKTATDPMSSTVDSALATMTADGAIVGTPAYMAPEQLKGETIDARVDQFAWGILAYELVGGHHPFRAEKGAVGLIASILSDAPAPLSGVPADVMAILARALSKNPDDRFASMDDLVLRLSSVVTGESPVTIASADSKCCDNAAVTAPSGERLRSATTEASSRRSWQKWAVALPIAAALAVGVVALRAREPIPAPGAAPQGSAAPTAGPAPTAVTDLPTPPTDSPEARLAFREGMQAIRDATWGTAVEAFNRARKADPSLAAAHFRFALLSVSFDVAKAREAYRKASGLRATLSERDQALLDAVEPVIQSDEPNFSVARRKMDALVARFPGDAELVFWSARLLLNRQRSPEGTARAHALLDRCIELDPLYADCWQTKGRALNALGRPDEASAALNKCIEVSPNALDCLQDRVWGDSARGRCGEVVKGVQEWIAKAPEAPKPYAMLGAALYLSGEPEAVVRNALEQGEARHRAMGQEFMAVDASMERAAAFGEFASAAKAGALAAKSLSAPTPFDERNFCIGRIFLELELGHPEKAALIAEEFLAKAALRPGILSVEKGFDPTVFLHAVRRDGGKITRADFLRLRTEWTKKQRSESAERRWAEWMSAYAAPATTAEDAKEALAQFDALKLSDADTKDDPGLRILLGKVHALAGDSAKALALMDDRARVCHFVGNPVEHNQIRALVGRLRESAGDKQGACAVYNEVLSRWGRAGGSTTVKDLTKREKALGCGS